jgi:hypothetical protein
MKKQDFSTQTSIQHGKMRTDKKALGSYYTPQHLALLIADETLERWLVRRGNLKKSELSRISELDKSNKESLLRLLRNIRVLDPSVGDGVFLIAAADWLNRMRAEIGDGFQTSERLADIVKNSLFGIDLVGQAVEACKENLIKWCMKESDNDFPLTFSDMLNIKKGNSLLGSITIDGFRKSVLPESNNHNDFFHWAIEYKDIMQSPEPGFDIILGNPPYGNLLTQEERKYIQKTASFCVGGGRNGTWNSAAHFISRSRALMKDGACLGFLVPNSILRVNQFSKTRKFLLDEICLWKIVDEGSPFEDVTLEMVSLFCEAINGCKKTVIDIESRRRGLEQANRIGSDVLRSSKVFSIYHDSLFSKMLEQGKRNVLTATRGRDIPKEHVGRIRSKLFKNPYITSGRSVGRYRINEQQQYYVDDWFKRDRRMRDSFENELLVATKNYRYPRCVIKPKGTIHGGGIVKISPVGEETNLRTIGLILNSHLIQYASIRYLTNYSQLTTCLNTGIMESLPIVLPEHIEVFSTLFDLLSNLSSTQIEHSNGNIRVSIDRLSDALVYELYFSRRHRLQSLLANLLNGTQISTDDTREIQSIIQEREVMRVAESIMRNSDVVEIEEKLETG